MCHTRKRTFRSSSLWKLIPRSSQPAAKLAAIVLLSERMSWNTIIRQVPHFQNYSERHVSVRCTDNQERDWIFVLLFGDPEELLKLWLSAPVRTLYRYPAQSMRTQFCGPRHVVRPRLRWCQQTDSVRNSHDIRESRPEIAKIIPATSANVPPSYTLDIWSQYLIRHFCQRSGALVLVRERVRAFRSFRFCSESLREQRASRARAHLPEIYAQSAVAWAEPKSSPEMREKVMKRDEWLERTLIAISCKDLFSPLAVGVFEGGESLPATVTKRWKSW